MKAICRTTRKCTTVCTCARCHPDKEIRYAHVRRKLEQRPKGT